MTAIPEQGTTPHHLLLATNLSARCDRALDRAAQLANEWHAELVALNVLDPASSPGSGAGLGQRGGRRTTLACGTTTTCP